MYPEVTKILLEDHVNFHGINHGYAFFCHLKISKYSNRTSYNLIHFLINDFSFQTVFNFAIKFLVKLVYSLNLLFNKILILIKSNYQSVFTSTLAIYIFHFVQLLHFYNTRQPYSAVRIGCSHELSFPMSQLFKNK